MLDSVGESLKEPKLRSEKCEVWRPLQTRQMGPRNPENPAASNLVFTLCTTLPLPPKNVNEIPYPFVSTSIDGVRRARSSCLSCEHRVAWLINILKTRGVDGQNGG